MDSIGSFLKVYGSVSSMKSNVSISVFDIPYELIENSYEPTTSAAISTTSAATSDTTAVGELEMMKSWNNGLSCRRCKLLFQSWEEQRDHFKSESHLAVVKPSSRTFKIVSSSSSSSALAPDVAAADAVAVAEDAESSSSDDELEDDNPVVNNIKSINTESGNISWKYDTKLGTQWILEPNITSTRISLDVLFSISVSTTLMSKDLPAIALASSPWKQLSNSIKSYQESNIWTILLFKSGKFAGGVFEGKTCLIHKVFKRYTIRAKAGGSQSSYDNKNGKAKSAGAMMRRQGEQAIKEDIQSLLREWSEYLSSSTLILTSIPKTRRGIFFDDIDSESAGGGLLKKDDERLRSIPFAIDSVTFESVIRVHGIISSLIFSPMPIPTADAVERPITITSATVHQPSTSDLPIATSIDRNTSARSDDSSYIITSKDIPQSRDLVSHCRSGDLIAAQELILTIMDPHNDFVFTIEQLLAIPEDEDQWLTPLHIAAINGYMDLILLLLRSGADPCKRDIRGRTPAVASKDKSTRDTFRRYRGEVEEAIMDNEDGDADVATLARSFKAWDWDNAGIGPAITDDVERSKKEKEKEKKKRAKQRKKEEKIKEEEQAKQLREEQQRQQLLAEQRAAEEKVRLEKAAGLCDVCSKSLYAKTLYTVFDRRLCSSECVSVMRRKLAAEAAEKRFGK
jgi:hypothetical protein